MQEKQNFWKNFANILFKFIILAIVGLFLFNIGKSIWKNHDTSEKISILKKEISQLENQSVNLKNRILYYQTPIFKELQVRKHLFYQKPGEKLVVLEKSPDHENENTVPLNDIDISSQPESTRDQLPNWQKWINYIFG